MKTVRWGLLSTANINRQLIPAIRASRRGKLAAVASRDLHKAQAYAREWKIPHAFGGYEQMLESGEIDAVYIGLPNHLHAEWSLRAMQAGLHVLCEKPFAIHLEDVEAMIATSRQTGRVLAEAFMYRHHPQTKIVGEFVHSGRLGQVSAIQGAFTFAMGSRDNVRLAPEMGGGALWDIGVYPMSYAQFIYGGPPLEVFGMQSLGDTGVDENFAGQMRYPGGGFAQFTCSFQRPYHTFIEICGSEGRLYLNRPFNNIDDGTSLVTFYPKHGQPQNLRIPEQELYLGEVEDMHAAILDGAPSYLTLQETRDHVRTVLALYESARTASVISL
jgi:predicted dehydrogenase